MRLDERQEEIISTACAVHAVDVESRRKEDVVINVQAIGGAGKSVIVTELTRRLSTANFLFLCMSTNIADRARATLPPSVTVETFVQAAHRFVCVTHEKKVTPDTELPSALTDRDIRQATQLQATPRDLPIIRRTLSFFFRASSRSVDVPHVEDALVSLGIAHDDALVKSSLGLAREVWQSQTRRSRDAAPICRGAAVKLWSLGRSTVTREIDPDNGEEIEVSVTPLGNADVLIVEEAQDLDDALIAFIARQNKVALMFGDDMQSLDVDAPYRHQAHSLQQRGYRFMLHHSYRFSGDVPRLLTALREKEQGQSVTEATGSKQPPTQVLSYTPATLRAWVDHGSPVTVIGPSAIDLMTLSLDYPQVRVGWVDGLMSPHYHFQTLFDLACLLAPADSPRRKHIKNPMLARCSGIEAAHRVLTQQGANFTIGLCEWVMANQHKDLANHLNNLRKQELRYQYQLVDHAKDVEAPALTLSTVRAAKGHEWATVAVLDSLASASMHNQWHVQNSDVQRQLRWLYTAISRAEHTVMVPSDFLRHCEHHGVSIETVAPASASKAHQTGSDHAYFGLSRSRVLEMSHEGRQARQKRFARQKHSTDRRFASPGQGGSGQAALKQKMEEGAEAYKGMSAKEHLASIKKLTTIK